MADAIASGLRINFDAASDSQKYTLRCKEYCRALQQGTYQGWSDDYPLRPSKSNAEIDFDPANPTKKRTIWFDIFAQGWPLDWE